MYFCLDVFNGISIPFAGPYGEWTIRALLWVCKSCLIVQHTVCIYIYNLIYLYVTLFQFGSDLLDHVNIAVISLVSMYVGSLGHIDLLGHGFHNPTTNPHSSPTLAINLLI